MSTSQIGDLTRAAVSWFTTNNRAYPPQPADGVDMAARLKLTRAEGLLFSSPQLPWTLEQPQTVTVTLSTTELSVFSELSTDTAAATPSAALSIILPYTLVAGQFAK